MDRDQFAQAFAGLAETCDTPLVIGLYGGWGVGKTTLMRLIEGKLDKSKTRPVWFDPWQHQFDENPSLALVHTVIYTLDMGDEGKKLLAVIAGAFGSMLLKAITNLGLEDIDKLGARYEEERFLVREKQVRLQERFKKLIEKAQGKEKRRIVFFIDDLDRCMPAHALSVLESLKLYLNLPGCVYFLGVSRDALEGSIKYHYKDLQLSETSYLDKIVQLPFTIPPIARESMEGFIEPLLSDRIKPCQELLVKVLGDNPRQVKRFINTLALNDQLASGLKIPNYNPMVLAVLLVIQYRSVDLYRLITRNKDLLLNLKRGNQETKSVHDKYLERGEQLKAAIESADIPEWEVLQQYISLTKVARVTEEVEMGKHKRYLEALLISHAEWVESAGMKGSRLNPREVNLIEADLRRADLIEAILSRADLSGADLRRADLSGANLTRADLSGADLSGADLRRADLSRASLTAANLSEANLSGAKLSRAKVLGANLLGADLSGAILSGAILRRANLRGANLIEADLADAIGLTQEQIKSAITDRSTRLPDYLEALAQEEPKAQ